MNTHNEQLTRREFLARTAAFAGISASLAPFSSRAGEATSPRRSRISYYCNGEIHAGVPGQPEGKPLTTGHWDFNETIQCDLAGKIDGDIGPGTVRAITEYQQDNGLVATGVIDRPLLRSLGMIE